jgi:hypothetical protein
MTGLIEGHPTPSVLDASTTVAILPSGAVIADVVLRIVRLRSSSGGLYNVLSMLFGGNLDTRRSALMHELLIGRHLAIELDRFGLELFLELLVSLVGFVKTHAQACIHQQSSWDAEERLLSIFSFSR